MSVNNFTFAEVYNDLDTFPSMMDVATALGISYRAVQTQAERMRRQLGRGHDNMPTLKSRSNNRSCAETRRERLLEEVADVARAAGKDKITASDFAAFKPEVQPADIEREFGTFAEMKRAAGLEPTRGARTVVLQAARHAAQDHLAKISADRKNYAGLYLAPEGGRFKTIMGANDLHDMQCDPFWLRVFIDTARRVQPDVICLNGDVFDLTEFGKYSVDPRTWDIIGSIKFVHEQILAPLRAACPNAQIDIIEGNHEFRLLRHMAEAAPALRAILSDLHGWDVAKLLGLDKYGVNYVAKGELKAFTKTDVRGEVNKSYRIYFDNVLANHFPDSRQMGYPGWNGHHHSHRVDSSFNPRFGAYEWHQFGCGHRRSADYTPGEKWGMGFGVINVDTLMSHVNIDYVPVTDFAVAGGQWYYRTEAEGATAAFA